MASTSLCPLLLALLFIVQTSAQTAPAPSPTTLNITGILDKEGQYTTLIKLLISTKQDSQIVEQVKHNDQGLTLFAPTDNAFNNLKPGTLNNLSPQQQVQLVQAHILTKFYKLSEFTTVSNPVRTQATTDDGKQIGLNIVSQNNQVNVSTGTGEVETQVNNAIRQEMPVAVYQVDKVLFPEEMSGKKSTGSPSPTNAPSTKATGDGSVAKTPASSEETTNANENAAVRFRGLGLGLLAGFVLLALF